MAITEKDIKEIKRRFEKQNKMIMKLYKKSGDKSLLDMLYFDTNDASELADEFEISIGDAEELIRKANELKQNPEETIKNAKKNIENAFAKMLGKSDEQILYDKVFEYVASTGNEDSATIAEEFEITKEKADELLNEMRSKGDIGADDDISDSDEEDESEEECNEENIFHDPACAIQEALCFIGDVVSDTGEKICDVLDEAVDRVCSHDFDD